jgi:hypothetical protein
MCQYEVLTDFYSINCFEGVNFQMTDQEHSRNPILTKKSNLPDQEAQNTLMPQVNQVEENSSSSIISKFYEDKDSLSLYLNLEGQENELDQEVIRDIAKLYLKSDEFTQLKVNMGFYTSEFSESLWNQFLQLILELAKLQSEQKKAAVAVLNFRWEDLIEKDVKELIKDHPLTEFIKKHQIKVLARIPLIKGHTSSLGSLQSIYKDLKEHNYTLSCLTQCKPVKGFEKLSLSFQEGYDILQDFNHLMMSNEAQKKFCYCMDTSDGIIEIFCANQDLAELRYTLTENNKLFGQMFTVDSAAVWSSQGYPLFLINQNYCYSEQL